MRQARVTRLLTSLVVTAAAAVLAVGPALHSQAAPTNAKVDELLAQMTLDEKIAMLHGASEPAGGIGQAGYLPGVPRLGIPPLRLTDGPAGIRTQQAATALPAPVSLASTFDPELARRYGQVMGREARAKNQDVLLAPMVNIVRVPQGGRNFETLGEDPFLASRIVAAEVSGVQGEGVIATVKHFAENNQENQRQSVSADVDEQTMREIELPGFESAIKAGAGSVMASYNKINGTWASENAVLQNEILRNDWGFAGFVMSDWGATHSGVAALTNGLDMEMPGGSNFGKLALAVKSGELKEAVVDRAVRRILVQMDRVGLLASAPRPRPALDAEADAGVALEVAIAGAVLLENARGVLPLGAADYQSLLVMGPTAKVLLAGGGGSAKVLPLHLGSPFDALAKRAGTAAKIAYVPGYDVQGQLVPGAAMSLGISEYASNDAAPAPTLDRHDPIDFTGPRHIAAGRTWTGTGTITAPATGDYELKLQTQGGRGSIQVDPVPAAAGVPGRGGRGGGRGGGTSSLLATADGLTSSTTRARWAAGSTHQIVITGTATATTPMQMRLNWITPGLRERTIAEAVAAAKTAHTVVIFAYDEGSEGRDRSSLSLLGYQDDVIQAVARANPRTIVVLNNGGPVTMPWAGSVASILQMWYAGQEAADATTALLSGDASPSGRLPVTFPVRAEDAPTAPPERYPGVDGHGQYSEGIFVGYRWYDEKHVAPLFPFGHGLSYTTFAYSGLSADAAGDGFDVSFAVKNTGTRAGTDVAQVYLGSAPNAPAPMAPQTLAGFERVTLAPGQSKTIAVHVGARELSYWSTLAHGWVVAGGTRTIAAGSSSRDIKLTTSITVASRASGPGGLAPRHPG
jgi:beta-glucosidase